MGCKWVGLEVPARKIVVKKFGGRGLTSGFGNSGVDEPFVKAEVAEEQTTLGI
jgi:hypothetical protein